MEIFNTQGKAHTCAIRRWVRQKSDEPVGIYRANIGRSAMYVVLSDAEAKDNKINQKQCIYAVEGQYGLLEYKRQREAAKPDAKTSLEIAACRAYMKFIKSQQKLEKMGRDAQSVGRQPEVDSDGSLTPAHL